MMDSGIIFVGLFSGGIFLDVLVGLLGSRRNIVFGWAFILSILTTPLIGLIITLLSSPLPNGAEPKYGCLGQSFGCLGTILLVLICAAIMLAIATLFLPVI